MEYSFPMMALKWQESLSQCKSNKTDIVVLLKLYSMQAQNLKIIRIKLEIYRMKGQYYPNIIFVSFILAPYLLNKYNPTSCECGAINNVESV